MKRLTGWIIPAGMAMASGAFAQAPASAPVASVAASGAIQINVTCAPAMPMKAAKAHAQGTTRIRFHVDETGKVTGGELIQGAGQGSPHHALDNAAMESLARCPFVPARDASGQPVASDIDVSYTWKLD